MKISGMLLAMLVLSGVSLAQEELTDADKALIKAVQDAGGQAMPFKNDARLSVAFHLSDKEITDETSGCRQRRRKCLLAESAWDQSHRCWPAYFLAK